MEVVDGSDVDALEASSAASSNDVTLVTRKLGKSVTLDLLIRDGILQPEAKALTIKYMGKRFAADLLANGHIQPCDSVETFPSPSAWVMHCKKQVNPATKISGCGWGTIRYKGQTLNVYKVMWLNKQANALRESLNHVQHQQSGLEHLELSNQLRLDNRSSRPDSSQVSVPIVSIPLDAFDENLETPVTCYQRELSIGSCRQFRVRWSCQAVLVMVAHCHSQLEEVSGYLGGQESTTPDGQKVLVIQEALPFAKTGQWSDDDLRNSIRRFGLRVCGWYHSHGQSVTGQTADPTLYDVECQFRFQQSCSNVLPTDLSNPGRRHTFQPSVCCVLSPYVTQGAEKVFVKDEDFSRRFQCFYVSEEKPMAVSASSVTAAEICGYPYLVDQMELDMALPAVPSVRLMVESLLRGCADGPLRTLRFISHLAQAYGSTYVDDVRRLLTDLSLKENILEHDRARLL